MKKLFKSIASKLPLTLQQDMKRLYFRVQICTGNFLTDEAEYSRLDEWIKEGDWVIDVGANVGHYTHKLSTLVGRQGRVIAVEPVPHTFELLAANASLSRNKNISLFNVAASETTRIAGVSMPNFSTGLKNYYMARITEGAAELNIFTLALDSLDIQEKISLIKIDVEGHELSALKGMKRTIEKNKPVLVVEGECAQVEAFLGEIGYVFQKMAGSPNRIYLNSAG